ncbi:hypothetical protein K450DRAFT_239386 [Umbelopsis ramanniana AG]|uniref:Uncharacterized protein n=1 Tax=Umbelopsis ramanniana AG TaxID=1314678 RepID=A0AAD5EBB2_UMBRA|nr:uncharacterized protein K450DRAFT_239386 [Umbelopsis ramanniana AG]KAI8580099.1 hypothetical protein K450DRAFT_239386 [Umbelopsis ramanniana AG]
MTFYQPSLRTFALLFLCIESHQRSISLIAPFLIIAHFHTLDCLHSRKLYMVYCSIFMAYAVNTISSSEIAFRDCKCKPSPFQMRRA